jgi:hypothetical protein
LKRRGEIATILIFAGALLHPLPAYADCELAPTAVCNGSAWGSETRPVGRQDFDLIQICRADGTWAALSAPGCPAGDGCAGGGGGGVPTGCPNVGDQCDDDSYYIGENGAEKIYATTSTHQVSRTWNNGSTNYTTTGVTSTTDGASNTDDLVNLSDAGAPYEAADYCDGLSAHGHSDWYLPDKNELDLFWNEGSPVAGVNTSGSYYWSSTEITNDGAWVQRFSDGSQENYTKGVNLLVRCVRSAGYLQACRLDGTWVALGPPGCPAGDGCAGGGGGGVPTGCPNVGDQCDDDSYYIGENGAEKIYATTSTYQVSRKWANGYSTTGVTSMTDGAGNTDDLVNLSDAGAPYEAADYCDGLSAHGHSDWYLPAKDELDLFWNEGSPVAGVVTGSTNWYWSSTEYYLYSAWIQRFSDGNQNYDDTNYTLLVRCVRSAG